MTDSREEILRRYIKKYRVAHVADNQEEHDKARSYYVNLQVGLREVLGIDAEKPTWPMLIMYTQLRHDKEFKREVEREVTISYEAFMLKLFSQQVEHAVRRASENRGPGSGSGDGAELEARAFTTGSSRVQQGPAPAESRKRATSP